MTPPLRPNNLVVILGVLERRDVLLGTMKEADEERPPMADAANKLNDKINLLLMFMMLL